MTALSPSQPDRPLYGLWSLWDVLQIYAHKYIQLGAKIWEARSLFEPVISMEVNGERIGKDQKEVDRQRTEALRTALNELKSLCADMDLRGPGALLESRIENLPATQGELDILMDAIVYELRSTFCLFVPSHAAQYYEFDEIVSDQVKTKFPSASNEIRSAGTAFAAGLHTACVFHLMRAAEIGVRSLGNDLQVTFTYPIELAEWGAILDRIDGKIKDIKNQPRSEKRDDDQRFYSEAAAQLRYFKDGWRIRVAHTRETFTEQQALTIMNRTREFFETIAYRLSE